MNNLISRKVLILIFVFLFLPLLVGCFLLPPKNQNPIIASIPITDATVGQVYTYNVEATDSDGDPLTYALPVAPDGMEISVEGIISWTPVATGSYEVTIEVSDGKASITQTFTIVVNEQPSAPSPPSTIDIEKEAKNILETQDNGREYFEQLAAQGDPDSLQKTIDYLKALPNVVNAEVGEDGASLWIKYKSGVEGFILTEVFGSLSNFPSSKSYHSILPVIDTKTRSTNKKAIILLPFDSVPKYKDESIDEISVSLQQSGYLPANIEIYRDEEVTVTLMATLDDYNFIYISTHGSISPISNDIGITTGEMADSNIMASIWTQLINYEIQIVSVINHPGYYYAINKKFFENYTYQSYPNSFVYINACSSYKNSSLADVFLNNGADVYIGWDNTTFLTLGNLHNPGFFEALAEQDNTLQQAYDSTLSAYYPATVYKDTNNNGKYRVTLLNGEDGEDFSDTTFDYTLNLVVGGNEQFILNPTIAPETYTITASAGPNGSISPSGEISVNHGSDQSFTITPNIGYIIDDVLVDESSVGAVSSYTFTDITQNHTISVTFNAIDTTVDVTMALTWNQALPLHEGVLYERWIQMQWKSYPGAIGYNIYRRVNQGEYSLIFQGYTDPHNIFSDIDVSIGNSYYYYVTAYGSNWETAPSEIQHLDTWLPCPYLISPEDNSTITNPNPTFTWTPVGISSFPYGNIYSGTSAFFVHQEIDEDYILTVCRIDFPDLTTSTATYDQDESALPLIAGNYYDFNTLAWGFDDSESLIAISSSHIWEFYYAGE